MTLFDVVKETKTKIDELEGELDSLHATSTEKKSAVVVTRAKKSKMDRVVFNLGAESLKEDAHKFGPGSPAHTAYATTLMSQIAARDAVIDALKAHTQSIEAVMAKEREIRDKHVEMATAIKAFHSGPKNTNV
jgi:peptidoglycan hydrolase CwlO-like protein